MPPLTALWGGGRIQAVQGNAMVRLYLPFFLALLILVLHRLGEVT